MILRLTIEKTIYQDGDILCIKKGSAYSDNGKHTGDIDDVKMYILEKDLTFRFNGTSQLFEYIG